MRDHVPQCLIYQSPKTVSAREETGVLIKEKLVSFSQGNEKK